ncbi:MAG: ACT domain-containing protein [Coriobacteriia bacterium]|nr:ACT domain-containing protein [Coriobacteriia bacterium]MBS5478510.1 ACT domain-containing protein [Coriobacteriia bacterium]
MEIEKLDCALSVCKVADYSLVDVEDEFCFTGHTDEERSLVCRTELVPANAIAREDGWRAFRVKGVLDFSLVGILAPIATLLADNGISLSAVSTFNTDYVLVKQESFERALALLDQAGYAVS